MRVLAFPVVAWVMFAAMMWGTHFSPLFNASLEDPSIHDLEHMLFLPRAAVLVAGGRPRPAPVADAPPGPDRYLFPQMTQNTFLAVVILNATAVLYPHYATLVRPWGPAALEDQRLAAGIMWIAGESLFLTAILRDRRGLDAVRGRGHEARGRPAAPTRSWPQIRIRERRLAERLASEREAGARPRCRRVEPSARDRGVEELAVALRVDVSAADHGDDRAVEPIEAGLACMERHGRDRQRARRLDDEPALARRRAARRRRSRPPTPSRSNRGRPAGGRTSAAPSACVRVPSAIVRDTSSAGQRDDLAALERFARVGRQLRLDADDARVRPERRIAVATPLASPPPPIGTRTAARSGRSSTISSPTVPWPAMIRSSSNGGMMARPRRAASRLGDPLAFVAGGPDDDDLGAVGLDPVALDRRRVGRHDDDGRGAQQSRGPGHALGVVARRVGDDAAGELLGATARRRRRTRRGA